MKPGAYGPFRYTPIGHRPRLELPGGARVALWVMPAIEFFRLDADVPVAAGGTGAPAPDVMTWGIRDYGNRVGIFRLMEVLDRYGIRATAALNSDICIHHPEIVEAGVARSWDWMGHNQMNAQRLNAVPPDQESGIIRATLDTIAAEVGARPAGWIGSGLAETWNTLEYLADEGVRYVSDWSNDDQPYWIELESGKRLVSLPYTPQLADKWVFEFAHHTADDYRRMACRHFDVLYREGQRSGRVMDLGLHPYVIGTPSRIGALEGILEHIAQHEGVWYATGAEIAAYYADGSQP
jgi:peptidoglycan/xylan/chitin deacetylase (PgdA/CDA1 family)